MISDPAVYAVDTNLLIYFFDINSPWLEVSTNWLNQAESGQIKLIGSELLYAELMSYSGLSKCQAELLEQDISKLPITYIPISKDILLTSAMLRRQNKTMRTPDAIHVATALVTGANHFLTNDHQLLKQKIKGITLVPLTSSEHILR